MISLWMVIRYFKDSRRFLSLHIILAVFGVALAVAALVIAMAVVSGYETTLRETVIDIHGHMMILERGGLISSREESEDKIQKIVPELRAVTPFALIEGVVVHKGKMQGILLEGIHPETAPMVMNLGRIITQGKYQLVNSAPAPEINSGDDEAAELPLILIGKGLFEKLELKLNDTIRVVTPSRDNSQNQELRSYVQKFKISGVLDLGRKDYNDRYMVSNLTTVQNFARLNGKISGWRVRLESYLQAKEVSERVAKELGRPFFSKYWRESNNNLFDAVQHEKPVIFIIISIMLVAAAFNVSSTLFVSVVRRYKEISILKAMGASAKFIRQLFAVQGLLIGFVGSILGVGIGYLLCIVFEWAESKWSLFPGDVYKLTFVRVEMRPMELILIIGVSMVVCFLATYAPAQRGARLLPVEGLRYE
jgi:lipoprotein-releasing system permease protein